MIAIRRLAHEDCPVVADLHLQYLHTHFSGLPGQKLLTRYYRAVVRQEGAVGYVAVDSGGRLAGYVCGVWDRRLLRLGLLRRHAFSMAAFGLGQLVFEPGFLGLALDRWRSARAPSRTNSGGYELRPIVVDHAARGTGVASELLEMIRQDAQARGYSQLHLNTEPDNFAAQRFYERVGFVRDECLSRRESDEMLRYVLAWDQQP